MCEGLAFADLINFIKEKLDSKSAEYVFKVLDLIGMYTEKLAKLLGR